MKCFGGVVAGFAVAGILAGCSVKPALVNVNVPKVDGISCLKAVQAPSGQYSSTVEALCDYWNLLQSGGR